MQYCAILSQVHRHKDALYQAKEGVKLSHQLVTDLKQLCEFYVRREEVESGSFITGRSDNEEYSEVFHGSGKGKKPSRNRSFSHYLSLQ